jgi:hypothetical protein
MYQIVSFILYRYGQKSSFPALTGRKSLWLHDAAHAESPVVTKEHASHILTPHIFFK